MDFSIFSLDRLVARIGSIPKPGDMVDTTHGAALVLRYIQISKFEGKSFGDFECLVEGRRQHISPRKISKFLIKYNAPP